MGIVFTDPATAGYHTEGHPEAPFRVLRTAERLKAAGHRVERPKAPAPEEALERVHTAGHLERVRTGLFHDMDTPFYPDIYDLARVSAAGALAAAARAVKGEPSFSLMRPPGHHAGRDHIAGFCYLNNLAAAVASLAPKRVAILDVDVHHGDGTEDIFFGDERVLFCSLHQSPLYPGTGDRSRGNCLNFPLEPGTSEAPYLKTLERALEALAAFKPEILAVSAGFDTYKDCPIAQLKLERDTYKRIGAMAAELAVPRFAALEGGYAEDLPVLVERFLEGFF